MGEGEAQATAKALTKGIAQNPWMSGDSAVFNSTKTTAKWSGISPVYRITGLSTDTAPDGVDWSKRDLCKVTYQHNDEEYEAPSLLFTTDQQEAAIKMGYTTEILFKAQSYASVKCEQSHNNHWSGKPLTYGYTKGNVKARPTERKQLHFTIGTPGEPKPDHHPGIAPFASVPADICIDHVQMAIGDKDKSIASIRWINYAKDLVKALEQGGTDNVKRAAIAKVKMPHLMPSCISVFRDKSIPEETIWPRHLEIDLYLLAGANSVSVDTRELETKLKDVLKRIHCPGGPPGGYSGLLMPAQAVRDVIAEFEPAASMLNSGGNELNNSKEKKMFALDEGEDETILIRLPPVTVTSLKSAIKALGETPVFDEKVKSENQAGSTEGDTQEQPAPKRQKTIRKFNFNNLKCQFLKLASANEAQLSQEHQQLRKQCVELEIPVNSVVNMMRVLEKNGIFEDAKIQDLVQVINDFGDLFHYKVTKLFKIPAGRKGYNCTVAQAMQAIYMITGIDPVRHKIRSIIGKLRADGSTKTKAILYMSDVYEPTINLTTAE